MSKLIDEWVEDASWRPIATAPRDGSRIALLIPYSRDKFTEAQCTDAGYWQPDNSKYAPAWARKAGGFFHFDGDDGPHDIQPTHWRPLA